MRLHAWQRNMASSVSRGCLWRGRAHALPLCSENFVFGSINRIPLSITERCPADNARRLRFGAVMLQEVERDPSAFIQSDNLTVYEGAGREPFASTGDIRELVCE